MCWFVATLICNPSNRKSERFPSTHNNIAYRTIQAQSCPNNTIKTSHKTLHDALKVYGIPVYPLTLAASERWAPCLSILLQREVLLRLHRRPRRQHRRRRRCRRRCRRRHWPRTLEDLFRLMSRLPGSQPSVLSGKFILELLEEPVNKDLGDDVGPHTSATTLIHHQNG